MSKPLVSVRVATYNHAPFIERCLEGILAQRTTFPFEVVIGEDFSTDGTREIVQAYAAKYPDVIRLIISDANVGPSCNCIRIREACCGAYDAFCEGDDYWNHPLKLQRQVDFLEANPDYILCFHDVFVTSSDRHAPPAYFCPPDLQETPTIEEVILRSSFIATASIVARRSLREALPAWRDNVFCGDLVMRLWGAYVGKIRYLNDVMATYHCHGGGISRTTARQKVYADTLQVLERFNEETQGRYAAQIRERVRTLQRKSAEEQGRARFGRFYYLLNLRSAMRNTVRKMAQRVTDEGW